MYVASVFKELALLHIIFNVTHQDLHVVGVKLLYSYSFIYNKYKKH